MDLQSDSLHLESLPLRPTYDELVQLVIELRAVIRTQSELIQKQTETIQRQEQTIRLQAEEIKLLKKSSTARALSARIKGMEGGMEDQTIHQKSPINSREIVHSQINTPMRKSKSGELGLMRSPRVPAVAVNL